MQTKIRKFLLTVFSAALVFCASCGGGGGSTTSTEPPTLSLDSEGSSAYSGGFLLLNQKNISLPPGDISGKIDDIFDFTAREFGGQLVGQLPELTDGNHILSISVGEKKYSIPFIVQTAALPDNMSEFADDFLIALDNKLTSNIPPGQEALITSVRDSLAGIRKDFPSYPRAQQISIVRNIQNIAKPALESLEEINSKAYEPKINQCQNGAIRAVLGTVLLIKSAVSLGLITTGVATTGGTTAPLAAIPFIIGLATGLTGFYFFDTGITKIGVKCLGLESTGGITISSGKSAKSVNELNTEKALEFSFDHNTSKVFLLKAHGRYPADVVSNLNELKAKTSALVNSFAEVAKYFAPSISEKMQSFAGPILNYPTAKDFDPDGGQYSIEKISDGRITSEASGNIGNIIIKLSFRDTPPGGSTPLSFLLVDKSGRAPTLPTLEITARLNGISASTDLTSVEVHKGGIIRKKLQIPSDWTSIKISKQPSLGTASFDSSSGRLTFQTSGNSIGADKVFFEAVTGGKTVTGHSDIQIVENCKEYNSNSDKNKTCIYDLSVDEYQIVEQTFNELDNRGVRCGPVSISDSHYYIIDDSKDLIRYKNRRSASKYIYSDDIDCGTEIYRMDAAAPPPPDPQSSLRGLFGEIHANRQQQSVRYSSGTQDGASTTYDCGVTSRSARQIDSSGKEVSYTSEGNSQHLPFTSFCGDLINNVNSISDLSPEQF